MNARTHTHTHTPTRTRTHTHTHAQTQMILILFELKSKSKRIKQAKETTKLDNQSGDDVNWIPLESPRVQNKL